MRQMISGCTLLSLVLFSTIANASSPSLGLILPRGVQRGAETEMQFTGARLDDALEIFFYADTGFEVTKLVGAGNKVTVSVKVSADCRMGEHFAQVRTASGISEFRSFYVGPFASVAEVEPNSEFTAPQSIEKNVTVTGIVQNEDVDYYVIEAKKGERISAEIEGMRLGTTLFDPYVGILDAKRFELSADDDSPLVFQDAVASAVAPEDGKYYIEVRESAYGGNGNCRYRLHVGTFPRPLAIYPAGGKIGETTDVRFIGDPTGELARKINNPAQTIESYALHAEDAAGISPTGNPYRLSEFGNSLEVEPNNSLAEACPAELPNAFNGIIQEPGDVDFFEFEAKKGQAFAVECYARRIRSALDPVMHLYDATGKNLASNDDSRGPDSYFTFSPAADGKYRLRVTDHLSRGAANFVYRIEFQPVKPKLTLSIPRVARYSQSRQTIYVARGNRFATLLSASRANFGGELTLEGNDLPAGITLVAPNMPANMTTMPVVFEAAIDAPLSGKLMHFQARHIDEKTGIIGGFRNTADMIRGGPGQSIYWQGHVQKLAIAVVDELPFHLEIVQPKAPIVRNGQMSLKVVATRKGDFKGAINVQFPFRSPGISASSSINIPADKTEILYLLNANGNAAIGNWPVYVIGSSDYKGAAWVSSQMASLTVAEPHVVINMQRTSCEQGQPAQLLCSIDQKTPFEGEATVQLIGIPAKTATETLKFTKDMTEITFNVTTQPDSPAGKHKNIYCRVTLTQNGESVVMRCGSTELQIDKPLPKPVAKPKPKPTPKVADTKPKPEPKPVVAKPLTRLQKLRLAAKQRKEAEGGEE
jgi:hypothetical protein